MESGVSMNYKFTKFGIVGSFLGLQDIVREIKCTLVFTPFKQQSDRSGQLAALDHSTAACGKVNR